jgi:D-alanyl-D-alanine-carboxypeptidase/D-alanyl-D-alanine-endopeptidase
MTTFQTLGIAALAIGLTACSDTPPASLESIIAAEVSELRAQTEIEVVSVAFVEGGDITTYHFGALAEGGAPNDQTLYDMGSLTKTHTGLVLAQAVSDELIGLDDPIARYLPGIDPDVFQRDGVAVTVRHLATHVSGMPTDLACGEPELAPQARLDCFMAHDRADLMARLANLELLATPGAEYRYSNPGIRVLGAVLEDLYDAPFDALVRRIVFARTGQIDTHVTLSPEDRARWRIGSHENGLPVPDASDYVNPAGGLKASTPDMGRYLAFYVSSGDPLADRAMALLAGDSDGLGRAYVWNTFQLDTEGQLYHGGGTFGTSAWASVYPREALAIFLVTPYVSSTAQAELNEAANRIIARYRQLRDGEQSAP